MTGRRRRESAAEHLPEAITDRSGPSTRMRPDAPVVPTPGKYQCAVQPGIAAPRENLPR